MRYKVGDRIRYKDGYGIYRIVRCDEEKGEYITVEEKEIGIRTFDIWEEKNMKLELHEEV